MLSISIIIPAKDEEAVLPRLLSSIAKQTHQPHEVIVADANSTDRTREIAKDFGAIVVVGGLPGPGRNAGARVATGDVFLFVDADTEFPTADFLERALTEFESRRLDIAAADLVPYDGTFFDAFMLHVYNRFVRLVERWRAHAGGAFILARASLHETIGGFDETVVYCEDHEYAQRGAKHGRFGSLRSVKIGVTTRRMERDGRFAIIVKSLLGELHMLFLGPIRHEAFHYTFGYKKTSKS